MVMPNKRKKLVKMRTQTGEIVEVPHELLDPYANETERIAGEVTVRRHRVTFLPGVNPEWEKRREDFSRRMSEIKRRGAKAEVLETPDED